MHCDCIQVPPPIFFFLIIFKLNKQYFFPAFELLKNIFDRFFVLFFKNLLSVFSQKEKFFSFIVVTPIIFIFIQLQIIFGIIFLIFYVTVFILFYFLATPSVITSVELPFNFKYLLRNTIFHLVILLPRAKAYLYFYNTIFFIFNKNYKKIIINLHTILNVFFIVTILLLFYYFNRYFLWIFGVSYWSTFMSCIFVNRVFVFLTYKYETKKAKYQHIMINCILNFDTSVGYASDLGIILKCADNNKFVVLFNNWDQIKELAKNFKRLDLFFKSLDVNLGVFTYKSMFNNNLSFFNKSSIINPDAENLNITISVTPNPNFEVIKENGSKETFKLKHLFKHPRWIKNSNIYRDRVLYFTPTFQTESEKIEIKEIPYDYVGLLHWFGYQSSLNILFNKDDALLFTDGHNYHLLKDAPTVAEHAIENKIKLHLNIQYLNQFEESNKDYLNTPQGKQDYTILQTFVKSLSDKSDIL